MVTAQLYIILPCGVIADVTVVDLLFSVTERGVVFLTVVVSTTSSPLAVVLTAEV